MNTIITIVVKAILGWLLSLWERFIEKQKHIEQGRQEVRDAIVQSGIAKEKEVDQKLEELRNANPVSQSDYDWLRDSSNYRRN